MRISTEKCDTGYNERLPDMDVVILCDGEEVENCYTADDELGVVYFWMYGPSGKRWRDHKHGKVEIHGL